MSERTATRAAAEVAERRRGIGAAIRRARGHKTQAELAARLGIGQPALCAWEKGRVALDLEKLRAVELELGLQAGSLAVAGGYVAVS